jgi:hypothetical protein
MNPATQIGELIGSRSALSKRWARAFRFRNPMRYRFSVNEKSPAYTGLSTFLEFFRSELANWTDDTLYVGYVGPT